MGWLRFGLPLEEEWEVEKQARAIAECDDIDRLRGFAQQVFRAWCNQTDITAQLIGQVAELEAQLAQLGVMPPPDPQYLQWARELAPGPPAGESRS
ncbi:MAG: hypothetical protein RLZZ459_2219 [Cyanobacteriota bacterium]